MIKFEMNPMFSVAFCFAFFAIVCARIIAMNFRTVEKALEAESKEMLDLASFISGIESFVYALCSFVVIEVGVVSNIRNMDLWGFHEIFMAIIMCAGIVLSMRAVFGLIKSEIKIRKETKTSPEHPAA